MSDLEQVYRSSEDSIVLWKRKPYAGTEFSGRWVPANMEAVRLCKFVGREVKVLEYGKHKTRWGNRRSTTERDYAVIEVDNQQSLIWLDY